MNINLRWFLFLCLAVFMIISLCSCNGDGASSQSDYSNAENDQNRVTKTTLSGRFSLSTDKSIVGIQYETPSNSGITTEDGSFTFIPGEVVTFFLGGVTLGSTLGVASTSPVDLIAGGTNDSVEVINITRFLLMLDDNSDSTDGVRISPGARDLSVNWTDVDFASSDLDNELIHIISDVASVDSKLTQLPGSLIAKATLTAPLPCSFSGIYLGSYTVNNETLPVLLFNTYGSGIIAGYAYSRAEGLLILNSGTSLDTVNNSFISVDPDSILTIDASFSSTDQITGTWIYSTTNQSGTFSADRVGGTADAVTRYTGIGVSDPDAPELTYSVATLSVNAAGQINGEEYDLIENLAYTVINGIADTFFTNQVFGFLSGTTVSMETEFTDIFGTVNLDDMSMSGSWQDKEEPGVYFGTYDLIGCTID